MNCKGHVPSFVCDRFCISWSEDPLHQIETVIKDNFIRQVEKEVAEDEEGEEEEETQQTYATFSV